jgi:hypothetical protein
MSDNKILESFKAFIVQRSQLGKFSRFKVWLFAFFVLSFSLWARIPTFRNPLYLNPDEAELLSTSKLAAKSFFPYQNYTTSTFGPVWPEVLGYFNHFGANLSFVEGHILSYVFLLISFLVVQLRILTKHTNPPMLMYLIFLSIDFTIFLPTNYEFAYLSTETLPISLISLSILILSFPKLTRPLNKFISGALCALAFLAKYQVAPLIVTVYFFSIFSGKNKKLKNKSNYLYSFWSGFSFTILIYIFLIFLGGGLSKFYNDSVKFSIFYSTGKIPVFSPPINILDKIQVGSSLILSNPTILLSLIFCIILLCKKQENFLLLEKSHGKILRIQSEQVSFIIIVLGFATIAATGNAFPHYLLFFMWALQLSMAFVLVQDNKRENQMEASNQNGLTSRNFQLPILMFLLVVVVSPNSGFIAKEIKSKFLYTGPTKENLNVYINQLNTLGFDKCRKNSQVLIWGWSSEYYTYFNWNPPEDIVATTTSILLSGYESTAFTRRIQAAVYDRKTKCIFEAIGPRYFSNIPSEKTLDTTIPLLRDYINEHFSKTIIPDQGGTLWVRVPDNF